MALPRYFDARPMVTLSSEGLRQVDEMRKLGWKQNAYAVREGCNSCPRCEALACYPRTDCAYCEWKPDASAAKEFTKRADEHRAGKAG
jgi:hypothetical protein